MSFGQFVLKLERWDVCKHSRIKLVSHYGGWVRIHNIPLQFPSNLKIFRAICGCLGGLEGYEVTPCSWIALMWALRSRISIGGLY